MLLKGFISFHPNDAKFPQKIDECPGRVMHYIPPKMVQKWLKNQFFKKRLVSMKLRQKRKKEKKKGLVEMGQEFFVQFSFAERFKGTY